MLLLISCYTDVRQIEIKYCKTVIYVQIRQIIQALVFGHSHTSYCEKRNNNNIKRYGYYSYIYSCNLFV